MSITRATVMEVDLKNLEHNVQKIREYVGENVDIMPVIKAKGYGTYINTNFEFVDKFNIVALATVDEGIEIRNIGYKKDIFILNQPAKEEINKIIENDIVIGISSIEFAEELKKNNSKIRVHIEVETGMGRTGIKPENIEGFINEFGDYIKIEGIYTHLSSADYDDEYTLNQINKFDQAVQIIKRIVPDIKYIHASASNGILNYPQAHYNLVRPGIILYGYESSKTTLQKIDIKPISKLKSKIIYLKEVEKDTSIGYGRTFKTNLNMTKVATIPLGYADGFRRTFSNGWEVLINGKKAPIIGTVCMDSFMVDVTEIPDVKVGDEVIIWDNENIKLEDLAKKCNTINYEILSQIGNRVPRKFI